MEDLERYLSEIVDTTIDDFAKNPLSTRHAFLACVAVFHSVDNLAYPKRSSGLRQMFRRKSPDFYLIDKVAHAFKHLQTGNPQNPDLIASDVIMRPSGICGEMV